MGRLAMGVAAVAWSTSMPLTLTLDWAMGSLLLTDASAHDWTVEVNVLIFGNILSSAIDTLFQDNRNVFLIFLLFTIDEYSLDPKYFSLIADWWPSIAGPGCTYPQMDVRIGGARPHGV
jgi:hypothetical protein